MRTLAAFIALLTVATSAAFGPATAAAPTWKSITPSGYASQSFLMVDGAQVTYYRFDAERPLSFSAQGPVRLKVLTRLVIPNDREKDSYAVAVRCDGETVQTKALDAVPSSRAFYAALDSVRPGVIRRIYIDVPTGAHTYELSAEGLGRVDARVFVSTDPDAGRVSFAPRDGAAVETLLFGDKELTYYALTTGAPVVLDVIGPTTIRVNTRLLFDQAMSKSESYVVGVGEVGAAEVLYRIETTPSETVVCRDRSDALPGALRHFTLEVGPGPRVYEFRLSGTTARALAIGFHIPRGDVANEP
jgi:hypothetical protein